MWIPNLLLQGHPFLPSLCVLFSRGVCGRSGCACDSFLSDSIDRRSSMTCGQNNNNTTQMYQHSYLGNNEQTRIFCWGDMGGLIFWVGYGPILW